MARSTGDDDLAFLQRLPQRVEHVAVELGQLIQEEGAPMREADLARRQARPAADERGVARRVVRGAERATPIEILTGGEQPGHAGDDRDLERLVVIERRQQAGDGPRQEGLAGTRRPDHEQVVPAGQGHLERPAGDGLTAHLGQVHGRHAGHELGPLRCRGDR